MAPRALLFFLCRALLICWALPPARAQALGTLPDTALARIALAPAARQPLLLNKLAERHFYTSPPQALAYARQAEAAARDAADPGQQAQALGNQGSAYYLLENYEAALAAYFKSLALNKQIRNLRGQSSCLNNIGNVYLAGSHEAQAMQCYRQSLALDRQRGDSLGVGDSYVNLATASTALDTTQRQALAYYQRALALFRAAGNTAKATSALNNIADTYLDRRRYAAALPYLAQCLALNRQLGNVAQQAQNLQNLGHVQRGLGHWATAAAYYRQSSEVGRAFPDIGRNNLRFLAETHAQAGNYQAAYQDFRRFAARKDSAFGRASTDRINELETRFQTRQKEEQIQGQQLTIRRKNQLIYGALAATALLLIFAGGLGHQMRQKHRANRALAAANHEIRQSMAEKEVLIQEIHHRVKNNLQLVSSLLSWQSSTLPHPALAAALAESQARIQSMALVHEHLYRNDNLAQISLDTYLAELLNSLHQSLNSALRPVRLSTDLQPVVVEAKDAIPFGLLANELVTNAYKHAFAGRAGGHLHISLVALPPRGFRLRVADDGVGLPATAAPAGKPKSLGMQLIGMLTKQLKATLRTEPAAPPATGTGFEITRLP